MTDLGIHCGSSTEVVLSGRRSESVGHDETTGKSGNSAYAETVGENVIASLIDLVSPGVYHF